MNSSLQTFACILLMLALAPVVSADEVVAADEFVALFDGESLDGWTQRGGKAEYAAVDGMIVGTSVAKTPNSFLC
ncbi:MAG: hypothetical protein AAGG46_00105, partial [Planctomycetota bacterium]